MSEYPSDKLSAKAELGGFSRGQTNILIGLTGLAMAVIGGLFFLLYTGTQNPYTLSPTLDPTVFTPPAVPTFPSTWTPDPSQTPFPKDPTATPVPTGIPASDIGAVSVAGESGLNSGIVPYEMGGTFFSIGTSVAGRPLEVMRFGNGPSGRMIVANIHGGYEWNTAALADELIKYVQEHPEVVPPEVSLYILRSLNPDGLARRLGPDGRANENGVDLNRNWDANWQPSWDRNGCWVYRQTSGGTHANSEPETQALANFVLSTPMDALISYHSAALGIFPGIPEDQGSVRLAEEIAAVTDYPYPGLDTGCMYAGSLVDWMAAHQIPAVDVELTNHTDTDFDQNLKVLQVLLTFQK